MIGAYLVYLCDNIYDKHETLGLFASLESIESFIKTNYNLTFSWNCKEEFFAASNPFGDFERYYISATFYPFKDPIKIGE